jgi:hypothetical protein
MNRKLNSISPLLRSVFAAAAVLAMLATAGTIVGLAEHYSAAPQLANAQPSVVVAQR